MKDFLKAFLSFGLAVSIEKLLGFILVPIYTSYFSTTEYGIIDLIQTTISIAVVFGVVQLETALQRYYYNYKNLKKKIFVSNIFFLIILFSCITSLILLLCSDFLSLALFGDIQLSSAFRVAAIGIPFTNVSMIGLVILRYERQNIKFLITIIIKVALIFLFVYLIVFKLNLGIIGVFISQLIASFISTVIICILVRKYIVFRLSKIYIQKSLKYALPQFPARVGSVLLSHGNRFFMLYFLSLSAIGIYSASIKIASGIQLIYYAFIMAWGPFMFSQFKNGNNKEVFSKVLPLIASLIFWVVSLVSIFSSEIFKILVSDDFYEGHVYLGGLSLYYSLFIIKEVIDIGPKYTEKTKFLSYTFLITLVINFIFLFFLIQKFELQGVVFAMVITNFCLVTISWFVSNRLYPIPYNYLLIIILFILVAFISLGMMFFTINLGQKIIVSIVVSAIYLSCAYLSYKQIKNIRII